VRNDPDVGRRVAALNALRWWDAEVASDVARDFLRSGPEAERVAAVEVLVGAMPLVGRFTPSDERRGEWIDQLSEVLDNDGSLKVQVAAAESLGECHDARAVPPLVAAFERAKAGRVREGENESGPYTLLGRKALRSLASSDDPNAAIPILGSALAEGMPFCTAAAWGLVHIGTPAAEKAIADALASPAEGGFWMDMRERSVSAARDNSALALVD
jgi:PBS lyase HEAT-like repeat